jgi:hypothetical protein
MYWTFIEFPYTGHIKVINHPDNTIDSAIYYIKDCLNDFYPMVAVYDDEQNRFVYAREL